MALEILSRESASELLVDPLSPDRARLTSERLALTTRRTEITDAYASGDPDVTLADRNRIVRSITERVASIDNQLSNPDKSRALADLVTAGDVAALWSTLTLEQRQAALQALGTWTIGRAPVGGGSTARKYATADAYAITFTPST